MQHYKECVSSFMTLLTTASLRYVVIPVHSSYTALIWTAFTLVTECIDMINSCGMTKNNFS